MAIGRISGRVARFEMSHKSGCPILRLHSGQALDSETWISEGLATCRFSANDGRCEMAAK